LKRKYSYGIIRAVLSHLESEDQTVDTSSRKFFRAFSEI
jgi:hypothetical protein